MSDNPLKKHFRKPEIFISLPSGGRWWSEGSLSLPATGEIPILSMTATDELYLMTPDALANGEAIVSLVESCAPNVRDAWQTPSVDLESLLVAIRIASVGEKMTIESVCPRCSESREYDVDLKSLTMKVEVDLWQQQLEVDHLIFNFRPLSYLQVNSFNQQYFEVRKKIQQIPNIEDFDQKEQLTNQLMSEYNQLDLKFLIDSIWSIETEDQLVTERPYIEEFVLNSDKRTYSQIRDRVEQLKDTTRFSDITITCADCNHEYSTGISLDYASFFEISS